MKKSRSEMQMVLVYVVFRLCSRHRDLQYGKAVTNSLKPVKK